MTTRKIVALLLALLYTAQCQESTDAASAFDLAASSRPLPTDQAVLDLFANPSQSPSESPFLFSNDTGAASSDVIEYGLSPDATSRLSYTGLGTVAFAQEPIPSSGAVSLGCGFGYIGSNFTSALVGVGAEFYQQGFSCGRCVLLQCDDSSCAQPGLQVVAQIVDQCGECFDADLNIGYPLFEKISGRSPAGNPTLSLSWQFVECSPYINDTIKMLVKPRGNAYYQAFNFANSRQVITAVQVNGQLLRHDSDHFWSWNPSSGPINPRVRKNNKEFPSILLLLSGDGGCSCTPYPSFAQSTSAGLCSKSQKGCSCLETLIWVPTILLLLLLFFFFAGSI